MKRLMFGILTLGVSEFFRGSGEKLPKEFKGLYNVEIFVERGHSWATVQKSLVKLVGKNFEKVPEYIGPTNFDGFKVLDRHYFQEKFVSVKGLINYFKEGESCDLSFYTNANVVRLTDDNDRMPGLEVHWTPLPPESLLLRIKAEAVNSALQVVDQRTLHGIFSQNGFTNCYSCGMNSIERGWLRMSQCAYCNRSFLENSAFLEVTLTKPLSLQDAFSILDSRRQLGDGFLHRKWVFENIEGFDQFKNPFGGQTSSGKVETIEDYPEAG